MNPRRVASTYFRLTAVAVGTLLAVQLLVMFYLWKLGKLSGVSPAALGKIAFVVVAFAIAARKESTQWMGFLAIAGLASGVRGLIWASQGPMAWLESGTYAFVGIAAALWWRAHRFYTELAGIVMLPLRAPISMAISAYGNPIKSHPDENHAESTVHTFEPDELHQVVVAEWQGLVHSVTYWSNNAYPAADLRYVLRRYADGKKWRLVEKGYLYWREDEDRRLWCSAIPAIGVGTMEYMRAKSELKKAETQDS